jgi:hypothetical protein
MVVRSITLMARVQGAPQPARALPASACRTRPKLGLAGPLGAVPGTVLPVRPAAAPVSVASLAFTAVVSVLATGRCRARVAR